jgi:hypothetical protein
VFLGESPPPDCASSFWFFRPEIKIDKYFQFAIPKIKPGTSIKTKTKENCLVNFFFEIKNPKRIELKGQNNKSPIIHKVFLFLLKLELAHSVIVKKGRKGRVKTIKTQTNK